ncbi:hypothetical protein L1049_009006 [Liquidambar formosana]|uniref:Uncharacterized protein n=1 Tax=Liquidambar formosana TaxID=63359 RepID=A0AAP0X8N4_LIQFO
MVLQRRLDYGFNGYQVPVVPRASRSARGRESIRKKGKDNQVRAFEILAAVAGKLLQERESCALPNAASGADQHTIIKNTNWEQKDVGQRRMRLEPCDQGRCDKNTFAFAPGSQGHHENNSEMIRFAEKLATVNGKNACKSSPRKAVGDYTGYGESFGGKLEGVVERELEVEPQKIGSMINGSVPDTGCSKDPMKLDMKPSAVVSLDTCVKASLFNNRMNFGSFSRRQGNMKLVSRDDDENSSGCSQRDTMIQAYRPPLHIGDRRIRKLLASKYRRVASKLRDGGFYNTDGKRQPVYRNWKSCHTRHRSQRISSFKRRKLLDRSPVAISGQGFYSKGIYNSSDKGILGDNSGAARGASSSVSCQQAPPQSGDYNVKLSIKSFRVPELFIEIPATATVGSLKTTVMEAVTAILGDGLHVGILLQGKKVRDDSKTLRQTGISQVDKLRTLGFTLEPRHAQIPPPLCTEDPSFQLPGGTPQQLTRYSATSFPEPGASIVSLDPPVLNLGNCVDSDLDIVPSHTGISTDKTMSESRALVAVPAMSMEALTAVPFQQKSRCSEYSQRRIRRPFSVSEVEALVQAVEKLGTGRWRDVKLRAFDSARHRTYVDLKDKWKTLVHTAKISPQQRRGEPVPQELLDRVLAAHAYWSQQAVALQVNAGV